MTTVSNSQKSLNQTKSIIEEGKTNIQNISKGNEEQYLEGEKHEEFEEKQIDPNLTENSNNNNVNNNFTNLKQNSEQYNFLQKKISKMITNNHFTFGINKSMDKQMKNLQNDIFENKVLMTEIPKNFNNLQSHSVQKLPKPQNFQQKIKLKAIKDLQEEKDILNYKLQKVISNEKFLNSEGYMQNGDGLSSRTFSSVDKIVHENKKKLLKNKKMNLLDKIEQIEDNLKQLIKSGEETSRKERIKIYIKNFEKDKEIIETRAKKYYKEAKDRNQRIANDIKIRMDKIKKEIDEKNKEEELKKAAFFKKLKEKEKLAVQKRTKINDEKANIFKPFLQKIPKIKVNQYLFSKKNEEFQLKEKNLVDQENIKRKERMKMDFNEINEFERNVISNREKYENENLEKRKKLLMQWKERKECLPNYISPKQQLVQEEIKKEEKEQNKKQKNIEISQKRHKIGYDIKNNKQPEINEKLKKQRNELIKSIENPKIAIKEKLYKKRQKKIDDLLLSSNKKIKKIKIKEKINNDINKLNKSLNFNEKKKLFLPIRPIFPLHPKPEKNYDYLTEKRIEKEKQLLKRNVHSSEKNEKEVNNKNINIKWEKAINCKSGTILENVNYIK